MLDVLVVDDDDIVRGSIADALVAAGHQVAQASDGEEALSLLASSAFDLAVCDVCMPKLDGLALLRRLRHDSPGTAVVLMTTFGRITDAIRSVRDGAIDYVTKPFDPEVFAAKVVGPIAERRGFIKDLDAAREQFVAKEAGGPIVGISLVMRQLADRMAVASRSDAAVFITGARGTGRKLIARSLHAQSARRSAPLLIIPCDSLPELMLELELRDLADQRSGGYRDEWFHAADGGTLVLDGVDRLPTSAQSSLLRVMGEPMARAKRDPEWRPLGVRVVSISETSPAALLAGRMFSERPGMSFLHPLLFRLNGIELRVPSLRERNEDRYALVSHFLREFTPPGRGPARLTPSAWKALSAYAFPGNVGELAWAIEHAIAAADGGEVDQRHLPPEVAGEPR